MGESRAWTVATGTVTISVASSCITGLYAAFSGKRRENLAFASAFNSAITAGTFFTLREYVVSPTIGAALDYSRKRKGTVDEVPDDLPAGDHLSWSSLRRHNLLDSGISGAATGGILRSLQTGRRTVAPAALTAGIVCILLQAAYNELGIQRIRYVGKISRPPEISPAPPQDPPQPAFKTQILGMFGLKLLSDEELLGRYRRERDKHMKKIEELEQELEEDGRRSAEN
ncbi:hypothetical protein B0H15DRAFT_1007626 [Mycena belliarum]|uniref:Uncharacterized protein n=1 Tax=Mycena belliarum TaxID=1033014 RepID=A0AAD6XT16_9AGAR|nr:hypothetical protein B0H15DRAFT_1007626 [Mycena belliae]